jgi:hypothetical protein
MDLPAPNELEMLKILKTTVLYCRESKQLDDDGTEAMMRSVSISAWFRDTWPEIPEARRRDLVDQLILRLHGPRDFAEAIRGT